MVNKKLKVLFIASGNSKDGISPIVINQGSSLEKRDVVVAYSPILGNGVKGYLKNILPLRKHLKKNEYNLVHSHYGWCGVVALLAGTGQKTVISFMGDDLVGTVGKNNTYTLAGRAVAGLNILLARHWYDHVIVKSDNLLQWLKKVENISVIPNGVDLSVFYPGDKIKARKKLGLSSSGKYVIFVSDSCRPEKNYALAQQAVALLDDPGIHLLALSDIPNPDLVDYYNASDCLVLTSFHEGSPNVIKEAMACNCPIVSTDVGDVRQVLGQTKGCWMAAMDPHDFSVKVKSALDFAASCGRTKGRERIQLLGLDAETIAGKIVAVYQKVLE